MQGIPKGIVHCKRCNGKSFPNISALRKHQWAAHSEIFDNLKQTKWSKKRKENFRAKLRATLALKEEAKKNGQVKEETTAAQLLERLRGRRDFMNDIVALVEGIMHEK